MKLDLLITLTLNLVKPQPKVREVLLSSSCDVASITHDDLHISDSEVSVLTEGVLKVISIVNDMLKARSINKMASAITSSEISYKDSKVLSNALNSLGEVPLWTSVALYRMSHNCLNSPYLIVIYCQDNLRMYKRWLSAQYDSKWMIRAVQTSPGDGQGKCHIP